MEPQLIETVLSSLSLKSFVYVVIQVVAAQGEDNTVI